MKVHGFMLELDEIAWLYARSSRYYISTKTQSGPPAKKDKGSLFELEQKWNKKSIENSFEVQKFSSLTVFSRGCCHQPNVLNPTLQ